jgi:hypothetical protein
VAVGLTPSGKPAVSSYSLGGNHGTKCSKIVAGVCTSKDHTASNAGAQRNFPD